MKRLLLLIAVSIVWSGSVLQAQEYEYVPLVREGIEWGYKNGEIYRFIGEEIINGKVYKQLGNSSRDYPDRKSTRLNSSHMSESRMPSSA